MQDNKDLKKLLEEVQETQKSAGYKHIKDALTSVINNSIQDVINNAGLSNEMIEKRLKSIGRIEIANLILNMENDIKQQAAAERVKEEIQKDDSV